MTAAVHRRLGWTICAAAISLMPLSACFAGDVPPSSTSSACQAALDYSEARAGLSLLILQDGNIICASKDIDTPHEIYSGTKSIIGLLAAAAVQDGLLTLDERAADSLPEWQGDVQKSSIRIDQLLSMTSGHASSIGRPQGYAASLAIPLHSPPGTRFHYGPAPMQIFGEILRRKLAAKQMGDVENYARQKLLTPLGIRDTIWRKGPDGQPLMPQGLSLSAKNWASIGELVRQGGKIGDQQLLDPTALATLFNGSAANPAYGLTWWLPRETSTTDAVTRSTDITRNKQLPSDMVVAAGAGDQRLYVIPSQKLTIVRHARLNFADLLTNKSTNWSDDQFLRHFLVQPAPQK